MRTRAISSHKTRLLVSAWLWHVESFTALLVVGSVRERGRSNPGDAGGVLTATQCVVTMLLYRAASSRPRGN